MVGDSRVAWREGLFLRPQHFQQQDRYIDAQLRARTAGLRPYPWGVTFLTIDESQASLGKFALDRCTGVMPDGTPFAIPDDMPPPDPLDVPGDVRDAQVFLTLPARLGGQVEFAARESAGPAARHLVDEEEVFDAFSSDRISETIEVARPNLRYGVTREQTDGRVCLGLARIREVHNGQVSFDDRYIAPCLDVRAARQLDRWLSDLIGRADQRVDELAVRAVESAEGGSETFTSFLLLQALNRWTPVLHHLRAIPMVHPERLYETLASMAGELSTMTRADYRRPPAFPDYDHENLQATFEPVIDVLQAALSAVFIQSAAQIPLEAIGPGMYGARVDDVNLFRTASFYLAVSARMPLEELRARFASVVKIGSPKKMREIVGSSLRAGVRVAPTPTPPPQIRVLPGYVYFELDRNAPDWKDFLTLPAMGLHVAGEWPELKLELWWVRRSFR